jgi:glyoxylase-like metal-dependent hydrolase (beta-lactamase superfamily II)
MLYSQTRRRFLKTMAGCGIAGLGLSRNVRAQVVGSSITATRLADNYALLTGAGANILVLTGPEGVLMVDGGLPEYSAALLKTVMEQSPEGRVQVLFNTHWHLEHTGFNVSMWQHRTYPPRAKETRPNATFYTTGQMNFGKEEVRYGYLGQAHTDGDIYVFFPGPNILMTGDVFSVGTYPILDYTTGGWIGGLSDATKTLAGLVDAQTRVIPGTGPIQTKADLDAQANMCAVMRTRFIEMMRKGMSAKDMLAAAPTKEFDARWGNPELFITNAYPGLWGHVREIGGIV